ncbi:MAG: cysteine peptidase family C39 domain-containing protein [Chloroflexota bacterium]
MPSLKLTHHPQKYQSDCLPACAWMILTHFGINIRYRRLMRTLRAGEDGTPFHNLELLTQFKKSIQVKVGYEYIDPMGLVENYVTSGLPIVVAVDTEYLPYWDESTAHAVVVAGIDSTRISLYDPWFDEAPKTVERVQFESTWLERDYLYGVIQIQ